MGREVTGSGSVFAFRFGQRLGSHCFAMQAGSVSAACFRIRAVGPLPPAVLVHRAHPRCSNHRLMVGPLPKQGPAQAYPLAQADTLRHAAQARAAARTLSLHPGPELRASACSLARTLGHAKCNRRSYFSDILQPHLNTKPLSFTAHRKSIEWRQDMPSVKA